MSNRIKSFFFISTALLLAGSMGCKKGTFDINSPNPNLPSTVSPKYELSSALAATAHSLYSNGFPDLFNGFLGYWAFSGDYGGYGTTATYNLNTSSTSVGPNWDYVYQTVLVNYKFIENASLTDPTQANYLAIAKIMEAYHYTRLVDIYNNIPYSTALQGGVINYPTFDDAQTVYLAQITQLDSAITIINGASANAESPGKYDVMFGGDMTLWKKMANTVKLQALLNLTQSSQAPLVATELNGLTPDDFLGPNEDAAVNPGYSNASQAQQNPLYGFVGFTTGGSDYGSHDFYRANSFAVSFYTNTTDTFRVSRVYALNNAGVVRGRQYGSQDGTEHNTVISAVGPAFLESADKPAQIIGAFESLFMQAEAAERGYLTGAVDSILYKEAVEENFRVLGVDNYKASADSYIGTGNTQVTFNAAPNKLTLILTQEWAALNQFDPLQAWNNWRRLGIPANLPVSIFPGTTASHIPYRLVYPASEYTSNADNVNAEGAIDIQNNKIFWQP